MYYQFQTSNIFQFSIIIMLLITCPYWLSSTLNNELKKLWYSPQDSFDTGTTIEKELSDAYVINLRSRIANKVFLRLNTPNICTNFDDLFEMTQAIDRSMYVWAWQGISVKVHLRQSQIDSATSAQSIIHKSILTKLTWSKDAERMIEEWWHTQTIFIVINKNICSIYINTSWASLHERWYRENTWEAPVKENIAAALVQIANWNFKDPLMDPCCGSWTICIEAAMIARNIAPGLDRYFAFEKFPCFEKEIFEVHRSDAEKKIYEKTYTIIWSDIDEEMIAIAKKNAEHAWVANTISFKHWDILDQLERETPLSQPSATIVSNPPYGLRMAWDTLWDIHQSLARVINKKTVILTGYAGAKQLFPYQEWSVKNLKNGSEEVKVYISK